MHNITLLEPERIARLPHFKGFPITATTMVDENGIPDFKVVDTTKIWEFKKDKKCAICGEPLDYWIAFMVTEQEAESRIIYESPQHSECLEYAFQICPWLCYSNARYSDLQKIKSKEGYEIIGTHPDREVTNERPKKLGIYICRNYENVLIPSGQFSYRVCKVPKAKSIKWIEGR